MSLLPKQKTADSDEVARCARCGFELSNPEDRSDVSNANEYCYECVCAAEWEDE